MIKIGICNHNEQQIKHIVGQIKKIKKLNFQLKIDTFCESKDFLDKIENDGNYDIAIIEMEFPKINGIQLSKFILNRRERCLIIFTSESKEKAYEAFEVKAYSYLLMPINKERFNRVMKEAFDIIEKENADYLILKTKIGFRKISFDNIIAIEANKHYQIIHLKNEDLIVRSTISSLMNNLSINPNFVQPHNSFIINLDFAREINGNNITLINEISVPMSKNLKSKIIKIFNSKIVN